MMASLLNTEDLNVSDIHVLNDLASEKHLISQTCYEKAKTNLINIEEMVGKSENEKDSVEDIMRLRKEMQDMVNKEVASVDTKKTLEENICTLVTSFPINSNIYTLDDENTPTLTKKEEQCDNNLIIFPNGMMAIFYETNVLEKKLTEEILKIIFGNGNEDDTGKQINIPTFLHSHIKEILPRLIKNAFTVGFQMEEGESYKIARNNASKDEGSHFFDSIIPVDFASTGILEMNKRYSEGVQQFLEMKHQLSVSDVTLTTNFMSYFTFYTRFDEIHGLTGTLGNISDTLFLKEKLQLACFSMPSHKKSLTREYPFQLLEDEDWIPAIVSEIEYFCDKRQAILLICHDMNSAEAVSLKLKESTFEKQIFPYWRDDTQKLPDQDLMPRQIIVSTALASRGTDISVSNEVNVSGGLHVILTYLPKDSRTERQIFGRTGRKGLPGSTRQMLNKYQIESQINAREKEEIKLERDVIEADRIEGLKQSLDEVMFQEELFNIFCKHYKEFRNEFTSLEKNDGERYSHFQLKTLLEALEKRRLDFSPSMDSLKESWAMWLTENMPRIQKSRKKDEQERIKKELSKFLDDAVGELKAGRSKNCYQYIAHAMGRSYLYENNHDKENMNLNIVSDAWGQIESVTNKKDHRYLSAAFYNNAYYMIKSKCTNYMLKALEELKKAKQNIENRIEDNIVEVNCMRTFQSNGLFATHLEVNKDFTGQVNLELQNENRGIMLENFHKNCEELIQKLSHLQKDGDDIKVVSKDVNILFKRDKDPIMTNELSIFIADGHFQLFDVEKEPKFCWDGLWCFLLGVVQVVGGIALCTFSAGLLSSVGTNLIAEGLSDCYEGIKGMVTGVFSWVQWAIAKAISLAISIVGFGINKIAKWVKTGKNTLKISAKKIVAGFTTTGAKQSLKQALKYTAKTAITKTAMHFAGEGFDYLLKEALEKVYQMVKEDIYNSVISDVDIKKAIVLTWYRFCGSDTIINENKTHSKNLEFKELIPQLVQTIFHEAQKDSEFWEKFTHKFQQASGPLAELADKTVFKDMNGVGMLVNTAINAAFGSTSAILGCKELLKIRKQLRSQIVKKLNELNGGQEQLSINLEELTMFENNAEIYKVVKEDLKLLAEQFSEEFVSKMVSTSCVFVNSTLKTLTMNKINNAMSSVTKIQKTEGYFREKRKQHKLFHTKNNNGSSKDSSNSAAISEIIKSKEGNPSDEIDIIAIEKLTKKTVVIDTYDENGKLIKQDKTASNNKETIHLKLTKRKKEDGTYEGHYELIDKNGKVIPNCGTDKTCLYQAIYQSETNSLQASKDVASGAKNLREKALNNLEPNLLYGLSNKLDKYKGKHGSSNLYNLTGGEPRKKTKTWTEQKQKDLKKKAKQKNILEHVEEHLEERINGPEEIFELARQACPDADFDTIFKYAATYQNGKGRRKINNYGQKKKTNIKTVGGKGLGKLTVPDLDSFDAAHTNGFGLKEVHPSKIKDVGAYEKLKERVAHTTLSPKEVNRGIEKIVDKVQFNELRRQYEDPNKLKFDTATYAARLQTSVNDYHEKTTNTLRKLRSTEGIDLKLERFQAYKNCFDRSYRNWLTKNPSM